MNQMASDVRRMVRVSLLSILLGFAESMCCAAAEVANVVGWSEFCVELLCGRSGAEEGGDEALANQKREDLY